MEGFVCIAIDQATQQCTEWAPVLYAIPTLTIEQAILLCSASTLLWASAWCWSKVRSVI